jgi:hypothetical protein
VWLHGLLLVQKQAEGKIEEFLLSLSRFNPILPIFQEYPDTNLRVIPGEGVPESFSLNSLTSLGNIS